MITTLFTPISADAPAITITITVENGIATITNASSATITAFYFEGGAKPLLMTTIPFSESAKSLPAGNTIDFFTTWSFTAKPPAPKNGIKAGESISFQLGDSVPSRIGVHVQSIGDDEVSASYVAAIPEPGAPVLFAFAAVIFTRRIRRR